ncbi:hypothetical protein JIN84_15420 [Luteolibacter yonseiensis]|uniref:PEP-CTERM sorting domain-containing protein n=1 Tax=Luteolibacter yonseiensis TaxID=1144680 RepID=A0A934VB90_9BACT|nr:hypothetical protein [Luteolibacter yonseiensis]MBK1817013.1 hypothetical protein [Luteolibacter yonseiensis]
MKNPFLWLAAATLPLCCNAAPIAQESFAYTAASSLTTQAGGSGWADAWYQDGNPVITGTTGLGFTDSKGNILEAGGLSADTTGTATTRNLRVLAGGSRNNVWISFLYNLPSANTKFEGVSFYRQTQQTFSISSPTTTTTANIYLTNNLNGTNVNTQRGVFGTTHLIVLKLTKAGGVNGTDRVETFVDPLLSGTPTTAAATTDGANFDFDRIRIAGQDGSTLRVDELRVGETFADVTPHIAVPDDDIDKDGLTDAQEAVLGLDPSVSDAALISGIQAHPDWFGLYTASGILGLGNGGVVLEGTAGTPVNLIFEIQQSEDLAGWGMLETINRQIELPVGKNFLRVTLPDNHP